MIYKKKVMQNDETFFLALHSDRTLAATQGRDRFISVS
jgi:hypothetical protein